MLLEKAFQLFDKGGPVMYPLALCSIIVVSVAIEKFLCFRAGSTNLNQLLPQLEQYLGKGNINEAITLCSKTKGFAAQMLTNSLRQNNTKGLNILAALDVNARNICNLLRSRTGYLDTIITLAPLLGLLGTITGMIQAFSILNLKAGQPLAITGGIGEALIATASGLCIAIIALIVHSYFNQKTEQIISELEQATDIALYLTEPTGGKNAL
ncbi:MAG: MotA/TolQ/ExbB proton channel family protein [Negativicutes bacterium]|jgi:biopolymer transport protein ExbB